MTVAIPEGLRILARREPLTEQDWLELLEARRSRLADYMREMTLRTLGEIRFVKDYFGEHSLLKYKDTLLVCGDPRFNLETRGIFPSDQSYATVAKIERLSRTESIERFWGLTRDGVWISIEAVVKCKSVPYKSPGRSEESATVTSVTIRETTPEEIFKFCGRTVKDLWARLGQAAEEWERHRYVLYGGAKMLADLIRAENELLKIVSR